MTRCKDCVHWDKGKCKTENRIKEFAEGNCGEYVSVLQQIYCLKQELLLCGSIMERSQCPDKITEMVRDNCLERIRRIEL